MSDYQKKLKTLKNEFTSLQRQYQSAQSGSDMRKTRKILQKMEKTVKRLEQAKKREQTRKTRKAARESMASTRRAARAKTQKARKMARAKREQKVVLNVSPGKTLEDYLRRSPHFKRPTPTALERARELTFGQGVKVSPEMLNRIAQIQEQKRKGNQNDDELSLSDIEALDELEREYQADQAKEAADEYLAFIDQQPSPTDAEMKLMMNELYGGKRRRKSRKSKKSRKSRKSKKSRKSRKGKKSHRRNRR